LSQRGPFGTMGHLNHGEVLCLELDKQPLRRLVPSQGNDSRERQAAAGLPLALPQRKQQLQITPHGERTCTEIQI
jgi:hypothetical protein